MLTGSSVEAAVLASVSAASSRALPSSPLSRQAERRLCPASNRALWGASSPTKLISPVTLTTAATVMVASVSSSRRIAPTRTPSSRASPSSIESSSACRCSAKIAAQQTSTTGTGNHTRLRVTAARLPMIQYSMLASSFSGSAVSLSSISSVWASAWTAMPASTSDILLRPGAAAASPSERNTAASPPAKAQTVVDSAPDETNRMANAAPTLAPEETPMMSGLASGLRNTVW